MEKQEKTSKQISNKNKTKVNLAVNVVPVIIMLPEIVIKGLLKRATTTVIVLTIKQTEISKDNGVITPSPFLGEWGGGPWDFGIDFKNEELIKFKINEGPRI